MMTPSTTPAANDRLYTPQFFNVFSAVVVFMTGLALQFHFGQYVEYLGHGVGTLGSILSISMVGTLLIRLPMGRWIDKFGCKPVWLSGTVVVAATMGAIQFTDRLWLIATLRTVSAMASATVMTTVAVFAAVVAPPQRRAESLGTMGLAGFLGLVLGPTLGDWVFAGATDTILPYRIFFSASAGFSLIAGAIVLFVRLPTPRDQMAALPRDAAGPASTSQLQIIRRHWPGVVLIIGVVFMMSFCWQSVFLERLAEARGFKDVKVFFLVYAPTAMLLRLAFRRLPERAGRSRTLVLGMGLMAIGQLVLAGVHTQVGLILPGLLMGAGHCFIFPSMVDLGAERFPPQYRGTGTSLILGAGDVGMLIGFVLLGELIDAYSFTTALRFLSATVLGGAIVFAVARRDVVFWRRGHPSDRNQEGGPKSEGQVTPAP